MKTIRQTAVIRGATPHDLYETIMDSKFSFAKTPAGTRITFVQTPGDRRRPTAPAC